MFPIELLRIISLHLPGYGMALNHELAKMYTEDWYSDFLHLHYRQLTLRPYPDYEKLFRKCMMGGIVHKIPFETGNIQRLKEKIETIPGCWLKAATTKNRNMLLNFNGDLFLNDVIFDTEVVDIDTDTYVKKYSWYVRDAGVWTDTTIRPRTPFIFTKSCLRKIYAVTADIYYTYDRDSVKGILRNSLPEGTENFIRNLKHGKKMHQGTFPLEKLPRAYLPRSVVLHRKVHFFLRQDKVYFLARDKNHDVYKLLTLPVFSKVKDLCGGEDAMYIISNDLTIHTLPSPISPHFTKLN